ncbi:putative mitochondrial carrier protein [Trypanosoma grayi]|uniref:putative mitochondrial carrier protein n=1 Tax=Trypanosoma grayi TaxID=71804 RepID=UPI0004F44902|nr:putative mitochondrial carrier protein [Trypanosoma grayi]KEG13611.1 putative mitochondrial carrier protein [Trypanosoma grayi]
MDDKVILAFLPGAAQGITTVVLGHPLDTAKTRMQALGPGASRFFLRTSWNMVREEGVRSLYRGVTPPLVMSATKRSLQFALWDTFRYHDAHKEPMLASSSHGSTLLSRAFGWVGASPFRAGAFAGGVGTFIGCPMHVIKIRTQFSTQHVTKNAWTCALDILRTEGPRGYFRGFRYHLLKDTLFAGCYLGLYDVSKRWLGEWCAAPASEKWGTRIAAVVGGSPEHLTSHLAFLAGSISSMATWTLLYPFDTVKTLVQARDIGFREVVSIFRNETAMMYRGLGASLVKAGPVCGVAMVVYELVKSKTEAL